MHLARQCPTRSLVRCIPWFLAAAPSLAAAAPQPAPIAAPPPPYSAVRYDENYSYLATQPDKDLFDSIKYVPLGPDDWYLSFGGQARFRYEHFNNELFGAVENDWGYALQRYLLHADAHLGKNVRVFAQVKSSLVDDGRELPTPRPTDADEFDLQQLFIDLMLPVSDDSLTLRVGRQDLLYGAQRLIGPLDWTNVRRTFDGAKVSYALNKQATIDAFLVRPVTVEADEFNDGNGNQAFYGLYGTWNVPTETVAHKPKLEAYALGLNAQPATGVGGDVDTYTVGMRISGAPKPFDYDLELDYQFGKNGPGDISAYSVAAEIGYTFVNAPLTPRLVLGADYASGDDDPTDADKGTFNQLFPTGHLYFGYIDVVGRQNIFDVHPGLELTLLKDARYAKKVGLRLDYHAFWRAQEEDGLYAASGIQIRTAGGSDASYIGSEVDLLLTWQIDRHTSAYAGYSHFFAGDFIEESTGPDEDIDFVYVAVTYTF